MTVDDEPRPVVAHVTRAYVQPTETFITNQIEQLRRYQPIVICHHRVGPALAARTGIAANEQLRGVRRRVDALTDRAFRTPLPAATQRMAQYAGDQSARLVHFHYLTNARSYRSLRARLGVPAIVSAYGYDVTQFPHRAGGLGGKWLAGAFAGVDRVLAMNDDMRRDIVALGCPDDRVRVHYHGVDTRRFRTERREVRAGGVAPITILTCGRLIEIKGQQRIVEALRVVRDRSAVPFRLVVVGDGPLRPLIEQTVTRLGMDDVVELVGHVPHESDALVDHYRQADIFVLASSTIAGQREGIPGVVVEAMAAGLPVVATRHGGIPAVAADGREALLVGEHDVGALAGALERLLDDGALRRRLGAAAARRAAGELDIRAANAALECIYDEVLR